MEKLQKQIVKIIESVIEKVPINWEVQIKLQDDVTSRCYTDRAKRQHVILLNKSVIGESEVLSAYLRHELFHLYLAEKIDTIFSCIHLDCNPTNIDHEKVQNLYLLWSSVVDSFVDYELNKYFPEMEVMHEHVFGSIRQYLDIADFVTTIKREDKNSYLALHLCISDARKYNIIPKKEIELLEEKLELDNRILKFYREMPKLNKKKHRECVKILIEKTLELGRILGIDCKFEIFEKGAKNTIVRI